MRFETYKKAQANKTRQEEHFIKIETLLCERKMVVGQHTSNDTHVYIEMQLRMTLICST